MWAIEANPRCALAPTIPTRILRLVAMKSPLDGLALTEARPPDQPCIFVDRAIGGKPSHAGDIPNACARPKGGFPPQPVDLALRLPVGVEIGDDHILVGRAQAVRQHQ